MKSDHFSPGLDDYVNDIEPEFSQIPENRTQLLQQLGEIILGSVKASVPTELVFICTHNSRRSQFGQIWAMTAAHFYGIENIRTYSGGTASTVFNPHALAAIERAGFQVEEMEGNPGNPHYLVSGGKIIHSQPMFSKRYDDGANPQRGFSAIMVCTDADEACPFVPGADNRISLPYDDPKAFDGTAQETAKYDERCRQIAREMFFVFRYVKTNL